MNFLRLLVISFFAFSSFLLVGMEKVPTIKNFLRTEQEKESAVIEFGDDAKGNLLSITSKAVYDVGSEGKKKGLKKILKKEYSEGDCIIKDKIIYEGSYGGKIFASGNGKYIAVASRFQVGPVEILNHNGMRYIHSFFLNSKYASEVVFSQSGTFAAVVECNNEAPVLPIYSYTLYTLPKKLPLSSTSIIKWFISFFPKATIIEGDEGISGSATPIGAIAFNNADTKIAVGNGKELYLRDLALSKPEAKVLYRDNNQITNIVFSLCDKYVFVTSQDDYTVKMFNVLTQEHVATLQGNAFNIQELRIGGSSFGKTLVALGKNQPNKSEVCVWHYSKLLKLDTTMKLIIFEHVVNKNFIDLVFE